MKLIAYDLDGDFVDLEFADYEGLSPEELQRQVDIMGIGSFSVDEFEDFNGELAMMIDDDEEQSQWRDEFYTMLINKGRLG